MANNRIFYACHVVAISKTGHINTDTPQFEVMKGVQSVGISTNITLEQVFELGQVQLYSNEEQLAEVEVTIEKIIDGEKLLYLQSVGEIGKTNLVAATNSICDVYVGIFPDSTSSISGVTRDQTLMCSGMSLSSVNYNYTVDGNATEAVTLKGNNKFWSASTYGVIGTSPNTLFGTQGGPTSFPIDGTDSPVSGIVRRHRFDMTNSIIPPEVCSQSGPVVGASGLQSVSVSADFGREDQFQLGQFGPYNRYATFPFEVSSEFEVYSTKGDLIAISGFGTASANRQIVIKDLAGTVINLGTKNRLTSVSHTGGDTGGGNATINYSYSTFNDFLVNGGGTYWS